MPDLSNAHFLERGLNWTTVAFVVFVCLAAAAGFLLVIFAGRVTSLKDLELKKLQTDTAEAAAHAKTQAALAQEAQHRLEADIAQARARHEELRKQNLELQLALEKERTARVQLEERSGSRHIAAGQRQIVEAELVRFKGQKVSIITHAGDTESAAFAREIQATLEAAGLVVSVAPALVFGKPQPGISLEVGIHRRQFATALAKAFVDAGIESGPITAGEPDDNDLVEITVGPKP